MTEIEALAHTTAELNRMDNLYNQMRRALIDMTEQRNIYADQVAELKGQNVGLKTQLAAARNQRDSLVATRPGLT